MRATAVPPPNRRAATARSGDVLSTRYAPACVAVPSHIQLEQSHILRQVGEHHLRAEGGEDEARQTGAGAKLHAARAGVLGSALNLEIPRQHDGRVPHGRCEAFGAKGPLLENQLMSKQRMRVRLVVAIAVVLELTLPRELIETAADRTGRRERSLAPTAKHSGQKCLAQRLAVGESAGVQGFDVQECFTNVERRSEVGLLRERERDL